jgi:hypothetical protein
MECNTVIILTLTNVLELNGQRLKLPQEFWRRSSMHQIIFVFTNLFIIFGNEE